MLDLSKYENENMEGMEPAPEGEYDIRLVRIMTNDDGDVIQYGRESGNPYIRLMFEVIDHPDAEDFENFSYLMSLPNEDDDGKQKRKKLNKIRTLGEALDVNFFAPLDPLDYNGKVSCSAILGQETSDAFGVQNNITQILVPR